MEIIDQAFHLYKAESSNSSSSVTSEYASVKIIAKIPIAKVIAYISLYETIGAP